MDLETLIDMVNSIAAKQTKCFINLNLVLLSFIALLIINMFQDCLGKYLLIKVIIIQSDSIMIVSI